MIDGLSDVMGLRNNRRAVHVGNPASCNRQPPPRDPKHDRDSARVRWRSRRPVVALSAVSRASTSRGRGSHRRCPGMFHELLIGIVPSSASASEMTGVAYTIAIDRRDHGSPCCPTVAGSPISTHDTRTTFQSSAFCDVIPRKQDRCTGPREGFQRCCDELGGRVLLDPDAQDA